MEWQKLSDVHVGQTGVVIGNGPSLRDVPHSWLDKQVTFGSNRCYLPGGYIPDYYVCVNNLLLEQFHSEIAELPIEHKFIKSPYVHLVPGSIPIRSIPQHVFSTNPADGLYEGYTVTFVALQLAYWMGFATVLLVGCDHNYKQTGKPNERQRMTGDDPNHFHPAYFKGREWNLADIDRMTEAYYLAKFAYEADGRRIINLTPGSRLEVFEKQDIKRWMRPESC